MCLEVKVVNERVFKRKNFALHGTNQKANEIIIGQQWSSRTWPFSLHFYSALPFPFQSVSISTFFLKAIYFKLN